MTTILALPAPKPDQIEMSREKVPPLSEAERLHAQEMFWRQAAMNRDVYYIDYLNRDRHSPDKWHRSRRYLVVMAVERSAVGNLLAVGFSGPRYITGISNASLHDIAPLTVKADGTAWTVAELADIMRLNVDLFNSIVGETPMFKDKGEGYRKFCVDSRIERENDTSLQGSKIMRFRPIDLTRDNLEDWKWAEGLRRSTNIWVFGFTKTILFQAYLAMTKLAKAETN